jgi:RecG-like helicase
MNDKPVLKATDAINQMLDTPALDPVVLALANDYLAGSSVEQLSEMYSISEDRVQALLDKRECKSYIDGVYASQGYLNRVKRLAIINRVIDNKLEEALETGQFSKKDLLDWMKLLHEMEQTTRPKEKGPAVAVQINNYDKLMKDLIDG